MTSREHLKDIADKTALNQISDVIKEVRYDIK